MCFSCRARGSRWPGSAAAAEQPIAFPEPPYSVQPDAPKPDQDRRYGDLQRELRQPSARLGCQQLRRDGHWQRGKIDKLAQPGHLCATTADPPLGTQRHGRIGSRWSPISTRRASRSAVSPAPSAGQPVTFTYTGSEADPDGSLTSWQWDLDGDGTFETTTPAGRGEHAMPARGRSTSTCAAVDDSGEASAIATQAVTIAAAGSGAAGAAPAARATRATRTPPRRRRRSSSSAASSHLRGSERASATAPLLAPARRSRPAAPRPRRARSACA